MQPGMVQPLVVYLLPGPLFSFPISRPLESQLDFQEPGAFCKEGGVFQTFEVGNRGHLRTSFMSGRRIPRGSRERKEGKR